MTESTKLKIQSQEIKALRWKPNLDIGLRFVYGHHSHRLGPPSRHLCSLRHARSVREGVGGADSFSVSAGGRGRAATGTVIAEDRAQQASERNVAD